MGVFQELNCYITGTDGGTEGRTNDYSSCLVAMNEQPYRGMPHTGNGGNRKLRDFHVNDAAHAGKALYSNSIINDTLNLCHPSTFS